MAFVLVAYCTQGSVYSDACDRLKFAANGLGINCYVQSIASRGGWCENTEYKPYFIRECLEMFPDMDIAYTDADSEIRRYPNLFDNPPADIVIRKQDFPWRKGEFMSGTFIMRNCEQVGRVVDAWINKVAAGKTVRIKPETWEQYHLGRAIIETGAGWSQLPHEYIYYDHIEQAEGKAENPVFVHMQYSRQTGNLKKI